MYVLGQTDLGVTVLSDDDVVVVLVAVQARKDLGVSVLSNDMIPCSWLFLKRERAEIAFLGLRGSVYRGFAICDVKRTIPCRITRPSPDLLLRSRGDP